MGSFDVVEVLLLGVCVYVMELLISFKDSELNPLFFPRGESLAELLDSATLSTPPFWLEFPFVSWELLAGPVASFVGNWTGGLSINQFVAI
jgi:hypothetical protein